MGRSRLAVPTALALLGAAFGAYGILGTLHAARATQTHVNTSSMTLEGPYTHENLAVYVIRGASEDRRAYITLDQGLAARTVDVREKGAAAGQDQATVNSLEIQNRSDKWLFLQAGDIVKGGKQDRTIMTDVLLTPNSGPQSIDAFCVERGRWNAATDGLAFKANPGIVAGSSLKRAIQSEKNQSRVWQEVARAEHRAVTVAAAASPTTMVLSNTGTYNAIAENGAVNGGLAAYTNALLPSIRSHKDAIGLAVAINGHAAGADVYISAPLFDALSRKLLESYALEALLARDVARQTAPSKQQMKAFLVSAGAGPASTETVGQSMRKSTRENGSAVMYEYGYLSTRQNGQRAVLTLHKSYVKK